GRQSQQVGARRLRPLAPRERIRDPPDSRADPSIERRAMSTYTSFGLPVPPEGPRLSYGEYLQVRELVGLQGLLSDPPQHDETLFIIILQAYELWFRQLPHEVGAVIARLEREQALSAQRLLQRCV